MSRLLRRIGTWGLITNLNIIRIWGLIYLIFFTVQCTRDIIKLRIIKNLETYNLHASACTLIG